MNNVLFYSAIILTEYYVVQVTTPNTDRFFFQSLEFHLNPTLLGKGGFQPGNICGLEGENLSLNQLSALLHPLNFLSKGRTVLHFLYTSNGRTFNLVHGRALIKIDTYKIS